MQLACTADGDGDGFTDEACGGVDCDDSNPAVNPAAAEIRGNGIDDGRRASTSDGPPPGWGPAVPARASARAAPASGTYNGLDVWLAPLLAVPAWKGLRRRWTS